MNEQLLEDIGLTKGEIKVYLTLLKLRETTTGKIIEEAQISSGKIYEILDKLIKKGLVSYIIKDKTSKIYSIILHRLLIFQSALIASTHLRHKMKWPRLLYRHEQFAQFGERNFRVPQVDYN